MVIFGITSAGICSDPIKLCSRTNLHASLNRLPTRFTRIAVMPQAMTRLFMKTGIRNLDNTDARYEVILIVPWISPPLTRSRDDGAVSAFICSRPLLARCLHNHPFDGKATLAYRVLSSFISNFHNTDYLSVIQIGKPSSPATSLGSPLPLEPDSNISTIIPHCGDLSHLHSALLSIEAQRHIYMNDICSGIDEPYTHKHAELHGLHKDTTFYEVIPHHGGPYVVRQRLIALSPQRYIALHDSDDFSCSDRMQQSISYLEQSGCDMVGCHEVRLDEIDLTISIHRFPLDVGASLEIDSRGGILHGTIVANRKRFLSCGGLSTNLIIANDTQFKLRAYFSLKMRNVDAFLYVRRRHPSSLTISKETALGSALREALRSAWKRDFDLIRAGLLHIDKSSLAVQSSIVNYNLVRKR